MRWPERREPHDGETRTRRRFLWLPQLIDGEWRWMETATWEERYGRVGPFANSPEVWTPTKWIVGAVVPPHPRSDAIPGPSYPIPPPPLPYAYRGLGGTIRPTNIRPTAAPPPLPPKR